MNFEGGEQVPKDFVDGVDYLMILIRLDGLLSLAYLNHLLISMRAWQPPV